MQNVYFYIDDSGVFHKNNKDYFIFGGYCLTSISEKNNFLRKYTFIERKYKKKLGIVGELKGYNTDPKSKDDILRSMNKYRKFAATVNLSRVHDAILSDKYSIQRYKDYSLKLAIKHKLGNLIKDGIINPNNEITLNIKVDIHNIATDGIYGLRESILQELSVGITNFKWNTVHPPIFKGGVIVDLEYCDSESTRGIRAADFVANKLFYEFQNEKYNFCKKVCIKGLP